ncbi:MAG TPA: glycosyltransferase [Casimicrobiaceae bacterium]|nr:glycosyltransferase [Casimicrobiaceae bacterium]
MGTIVAAGSLAIWAYLLVARGGFWRVNEREDDAIAFNPDAWPSVIAVVPARNEAASIADTVRSLLQQDYAGAFRVIVVDDDSSDGTAERARQAAESLCASHRLSVLRAPALQQGWTGKVSAQRYGIAHAEREAPDYLWLTDADICGTPDVLTQLVGRAARDRLALVSMMAKLHCTTLPERALIPAFVFFFRMLYPFAWVNRPSARTAAAAGGCMLVRREALKRAGGIDAIRNELIDDCALARLLKREGPIFLGLTRRVESLRIYGSVRDIGDMVARTAYAQLRYSPWLLLVTVAGLVMTFLAPPLLALLGSGLARWLAAAASLSMTLAWAPMVRFYRLRPWWVLVLPVAATLYLAFTLQSAYRALRGRGGAWKGRVHVPARPDGAATR